LKVEYQWDASSNRTTMTATAGSTPKVTNYTYDNALRLSTVKRADNVANQITYNYDPVGLRVGLTLPNEISKIFNGSFKNAEKVSISKFGK